MFFLVCVSNAISFTEWSQKKTRHQFIGNGYQAWEDAIILQELL
jgi:hypothetical protein